MLKSQLSHLYPNSLRQLIYTKWYNSRRLDIGFSKVKRELGL